MYAKLLGILVTRLATEKVIISVLLFIADWLVNRTTTKVDDKWFAIIEKALMEDSGDCQNKDSKTAKGK